MIWQTTLKYIINCYRKVQENTLSCLIMLVNIGPTIGGYGLFNQPSVSMQTVLWSCHFGLLFYVYSVAAGGYVARYAVSLLDTVQSFYVLIGNLVLFNNGFWCMYNRSALLRLLKIIQINDTMANDSGRELKRLQKFTSIIKKAILVFYFFILVDSSMHFPAQTTMDTLTSPEKYCMIKCMGLQPVTKSPNYEICICIIILQGVSMVSMVISYKSALILLFTHTTAMYDILSAEILTIRDNCDPNRNTKTIIKERVSELAYRHALVLKTVKMLKSIYSTPIGVDFSGHALCICLSFILPASRVRKFTTTIMFCFTDFLMYCFLCQRLENASEKFERAVYSCGWETFDLADQKSVYIMLTQAQRPISILAAGIIPVRMYTFAITLQNIYKFAAAFKT